MKKIRAKYGPKIEKAKQALAVASERLAGVDAKLKPHLDAVNAAERLLWDIVQRGRAGDKDILDLAREIYLDPDLDKMTRGPNKDKPPEPLDAWEAMELQHKGPEHKPYAERLAFYKRQRPGLKVPPEVEEAFRAADAALPSIDDLTSELGPAEQDHEEAENDLSEVDVIDAEIEAARDDALAALSKSASKARAGIEKHRGAARDAHDQHKGKTRATLKGVRAEHEAGRNAARTNAQG